MRVKRGFATRRRHKKMLKRAEGFRGRRSTCFKLAKRSVQKAWKYEYRDRRAGRREFRTLWIARLNAAVRTYGFTYSAFIAALPKAKVELNRKSLSQLAIHHPSLFQAVVEKVKPHLAS